MKDKKVVYITGGSKGIGKGIAQYLSSKGYRIAISSRKLSSAFGAAKEINANQDEVLALHSDVRKPEDEVRAVNEIINKWGHLDVLVANAGIGAFKPIDEMTHELWHQIIDTNVTGIFNSVKASLDQLVKSKGYIITMASLAGINFLPGGTAYNASKFAVVGFTQALMLDVRQRGIKVTTIMPGSVASYFDNHIPSEKDAWKIQPEDLGQMVYDLLRMNPRTLPSKIEIRPSKPPVR